MQSKLFRQGLPFALSALAMGAASLAQAAPTSGAYTTDVSNTWVQDRVGDRIGTVNMIMCIIGSMRGDAMVNQGLYVALIDNDKCEGRGSSGKSTSTSAGASNATDYMSALVSATQASSTSPLVMRARIAREEDMGSGPEKITIHVYVNARAGQSAEHPNGLFEMYFCGRPDSATGTSLQDCMMRGSLQSSENGLSFIEEEPGPGNSLRTTKLILNTTPGTDAGSGRVSGEEDGQAYDYRFAYNQGQFCRDDGTAETCFNRSAAAGDYSTWRYGTYNADGSRLDLAHPGFSVKFQQTGSEVVHYGFWSFWGLWLPEAALNNLGNGSLTRRVGETDVPLTIQKHPGKLWRLTRTASTLDNVKNVSMMIWTPPQSQPAIGTLLPSTSYELKWNGTALQAVATQSCGNEGCSPQPLSQFIDISADDLRNASMRALPVFFQAGGSNGTVNVPDSGNFAGATAVFYRVRDMVKPGDPTLHLDCVAQCLKSGTDLTTALTGGQHPFDGSWGPSLSKRSYTFSGGDLTDDDNANAAVSAATVAKEQMGNYTWGVNSGSMIDHADIGSVRCDHNNTPNPSGQYYCPSLFDKAQVIYQWETGPNQWNQYFGAAGVTIDPPKDLTLAAHYVGPNNSANTIYGGAAASYHGNSLRLQFSGFGELQGIPGGCVDPDTNEARACNQNTRWVPAFNVVDGAAVSDGTATYYVRHLEREMRLSSMVRDSNSPTLPSSSLNLPDASLISVNAYDPSQNGAEPASPEPAVIHGVVQTAQ